MNNTSSSFINVTGTTGRSPSNSSARAAGCQYFRRTRPPGVSGPDSVSMRFVSKLTMSPIIAWVRTSAGSASDDELVRWSASKIAEHVRRRDVSAVDVLAAHTAHAAKRNSDLNAITRINEEAFGQAAEVDRLVAEGIYLPLAGTTVTIKDNVDVAGESTPNGLAELHSRVAAADAPLVENLRASGAVILGRTNTPEFSWRWHTDNSLFGPTINPWDPSLTPGGSSGGASSALASGMCCLAVGNDAGGSLRWPANCTGVSALRPTIGRVPSHNVTASGERPLGIDLAAVQGPMARSATDVRAMFDVMAGASWRDPSYVPAPLTATHAKRAGWCFGAGPEPHPEVVAAIESARDALRDDGWTVQPVQPPDLMRSARGWATLINTDFHQTSRQMMLEIGSPAIAMMLDVFDSVGPAVDLAGMYSLLADRTAQLRQWQQLLTVELDVVILPVAMEPAWAANDDTTSIGRLEEIFAANTPLVAFNFLGLPVAAQPTSVTGTRPCGVQIVARRFAEHVALDAAASIERVLGLLNPP